MIQLVKRSWLIYSCNSVAILQNSKKWYNCWKEVDYAILAIVSQSYKIAKNDTIVEKKLTILFLQQCCNLTKLQKNDTIGEKKLIQQGKKTFFLQ